MNDKKLLKTYARWNSYDIAANALQHPPGEMRDSLQRVLHLRSAERYAAVAKATAKPYKPAPPVQKPFLRRVMAGIRTCIIVIFVFVLIVILAAMTH